MLLQEIYILNRALSYRTSPEVNYPKWWINLNALVFVLICEICSSVLITAIIGPLPKIIINAPWYIVFQPKIGNEKWQGTAKIHLPIIQRKRINKKREIKSAEQPTSTHTYIAWCRRWFFDSIHHTALTSRIDWAEPCVKSSDINDPHTCSACHF